MAELKTRIGDATKVAMKAREKQRLGALRLINSEIKRIEVDERRELTDDDVLTILNRMLKQRNDSLAQFTSAGRNDLAEQEQFEINLIQEFMPVALSEAELDGLLSDIINETGAVTMKDMGKVMARLKEAAHGRADMASLSAKVKARLGD
ncbi:MAG: GatB/YqeY domain-containing protein [Proteobacteria bacterium]|nr:GatB/YqeY domain-containing protein [Pseudomonadota bacterium]